MWLTWFKILKYYKLYIKYVLIIFSPESGDKEPTIVILDTFRDMSIKSVESANLLSTFRSFFPDDNSYSIDRNLGDNVSRCVNNIFI